MQLTTLLLSRIQFGFTIGFHILFPTLNLGLAVFLSIMEGIALKTGAPIYLRICKFWSKIFALTFGMGVVSGIVLAYELGTNFGPFIAAAGSVLGPLFSYEVLSAFFLEAGFLGIMLFGWEKVGAKLHYAATLLVTIGTTISAFWIMSANSWMQTPAGYHVVAGQYIVDSWWDVIFNPSFIPRFIHMVMASYVTSCFFIGGISAWFLLKQRHLSFAKTCFSFAIVAAFILTPLQVMVGDRVGLNVHEQQPLKTAAMEGLWETTRGAELILFAIPHPLLQKNTAVISIPYLASLINTHHLDGELIGLKTVPLADQPLTPTVFFSFRIMVGLGLMMFAVATYGVWLLLRRKLYLQRYFLMLCVALTPAGFISTIAGWLTAETGRQPWIIYHLLRTAAGASLVPVSQVMISTILFVVVYGFIFSFYLLYLCAMIQKGPVTTESGVKETEIPFHYLPGGDPQ